MAAIDALLVINGETEIAIALSTPCDHPTDDSIIRLIHCNKHFMKSCKISQFQNIISAKGAWHFSLFKNKKMYPHNIFDGFIF